MLTISKKSKYALRALLALARRREQRPAHIAELAEGEDIPKKFLELILLELKNAGILQSRKGRGGGYALAREPGAITVGEVIRALDGPVAPAPCTGHSAGRRCDACDGETPESVRAIMDDARAAAAVIVDRENLAGMLRREEQLQQARRRVLSYAI